MIINNLCCLLLSIYIEGEANKLRGLYYLSARNQVNHLDIIGKLKKIRGSSGGRNRGSDKEHNKNALKYKCRETFKDDSYLVGKSDGSKASMLLTNEDLLE